MSTDDASSSGRPAERCEIIAKIHKILVEDPRGKLVKNLRQLEY